MDSAANGAFLESASEKLSENSISAEMGTEILVTAAAEDLDDLLEDRVPDETNSDSVCYLLTIDDPLAAELVNRGLLSELPANDCIIRLEICSK